MFLENTYKSLHSGESNIIGTTRAIDIPECKIPINYICSKSIVFECSDNIGEIER